jgi:hypothetical protein
MKLYLAMTTSATLMEGDYEKLLGVFSTPEKAIETFKDEWGFNKAAQLKEYAWKYIHDGELTIYFEVVDAELDKARYGI